MLSTQKLKLSLAADGLKQPLYLKIRQLLRECILSDFEEGQRFFSERELMEKFEASQPTIHRALTELAEEGYLESKERRGFFVRRRMPVRYVGMVVPGSEGNEFVQACREQGCTLNVYGFHKTDGIEDIFRSIRHKPAEERIVMCGLTVELTLALGARLQAAGYQHLVIGPRIPGFTGGTLSTDLAAEVDLVIDHLVGLGHERILFIVNEPRVLLLTSLRAEMVERKLAERGLSLSRLVFCDTHNWDSSYDAAYQKVGEALADAGPGPTAIVPLSGAGAWAAERYALLHGLRIPEDLSIVSFDAMKNAAFLPVPLTEITLSYQEIADRAIEHLWASDRVSEVNILVRPQLVVRQSTGPARRA
ncbi:MAG TPA: GntR family transcriptional regulator [Candidatus Methylacidiphilales bacterium]